MADADVRIGRVVAAFAAGALVVALAGTAAFGLLRRWHMPAGGERNSSALIAPIPEPRLQTSPQLDHARGPDAPPPEIEQKLGASVPHGLSLSDANGLPVDWKAWAADPRPTLLLPAWYRCDTLCGTVAHGAIEALADTGLPPSAWRLALFSIDPTDTPADARALQTVYAKYAIFARPAVYAAEAPDLQLLTGDAVQTHALARTIGFRWLEEPPSSGNAAPRFAHATGLVVLTPEGVVSRYLFGVRFEPTTLRAAIVEAGQGRVGTLADRLLLACSHFDPQLGTRDGLVLMLMRGVALAVLASLGTWMWRHRAKQRGNAA
jgi:protein SCO1/2